MMGKPVTDVLPLMATVAWVLLFSGVAIWRFGREEF